MSSAPTSALWLKPKEEEEENKLIRKYDAPRWFPAVRGIYTRSFRTLCVCTISRAELNLCLSYGNNSLPLERWTIYKYTRDYRGKTKFISRLMHYNNSSPNIYSDIRCFYFYFSRGKIALASIDARILWLYVWPDVRWWKYSPTCVNAYSLARPKTNFKKAIFDLCVMDVYRTAMCVPLNERISRNRIYCDKESPHTLRVSCRFPAKTAVYKTSCWPEQSSSRVSALVFLHLFSSLVIEIYIRYLD